jgi:hypothetical protein
MKKILFTLCLAAALTGARGQIYIDSYRFGGAADDTSVVLLLNFNGANNDTVFTDASANNFTITRLGTPVISTTQSKFGGASGFFNAEGNVITAPSDTDFDMGSGNFTMECWIYATSTARQILFARGNNSGATETFGFSFEINAQNKIQFNFVDNNVPANITSAISSASNTINTWTHLAVVRNVNTLTIYINGTADGTLDLTGKTMNTSTETVRIGDFSTAGSVEFLGYMDDLRITKGKALYTANFTAPTSELTKITN